MKLKRESLKRWRKRKKNCFNSLFLLRPLMETTRFDIKKLCQIWRLPIYPDITNQNLSSTRNRIRLQLLPIFRFFFNPQIDTILTQFAQINLQEQDYLDYLTTRLIKDLFSKRKNLQDKALNSFQDFYYKQNFYFCKIKTKKNLIKQKEAKFYQGDTFCKASRFLSENVNKKKTNFDQIKKTFYRKPSSKFLQSKSQVSKFLRSKNQDSRSEYLHFEKQNVRETSLHVLYKFEFQNQPFFFIPLAIQKRIGKKLIEYFLNKKVNFFHVEHLMKYLKNSQNLI